MMKGIVQSWYGCLEVSRVMSEYPDLSESCLTAVLRGRHLVSVDMF